MSKFDPPLETIVMLSMLLVFIMLLVLGIKEGEIVLDFGWKNKPIHYP